jgi:spore coat polysaccharide biosynthesis protein SpsF
MICAKDAPRYESPREKGSSLPEKINVLAVIQARMCSTRLPGKILFDLAGKPVLRHVIERLSRCEKVGKIVVATTVLPEDDIVFKSALEWGTDCVRGSSQDVLSRFDLAAKTYPCDAVMRVTSDCPLIDPWLCDDIIDFYNKIGSLYVTNAGPNSSTRTFPRGLDCEVFSSGLLAEANERATEDYEREHVTPYMYWKNSNISYYKDNADHSNLRWTLDTPEDYELIKLLYSEIYRPGKPFSWREALDAQLSHPEWIGINSEVKQKQVRQNIV